MTSVAHATIDRKELMPTTKVSIIYYSQPGTISTMAHRLANTAEKLGA